MESSFLQCLDPKKRRALIGSFVLGVLVMAFFAFVLAVSPGSRTTVVRTAVDEPATARDSDRSVASSVPRFDDSGD